MKHSSAIGHVISNGSMDHWVRFGCPMEQGLLPAGNTAVLLDERQKPIESHSEVTARWPDGSAKWLLFDAIVNQATALYVHPNGLQNTPSKANSGTLAVDGSDIVVAQTQRIKPTLSLQQQLVHLDIEQHEHYNNGVVEQLTCDYRCELVPLLTLRLQVFYCAQTRAIEVSFNVVNRAASEHEHGCWDLGDKNSLMIDELAVELSLNDQQQAAELCLYSPDGVQHYALEASQEFQLTQYSSGGDNWQSPVHVDRNNKTTVVKHGYVLETHEHQRLCEGLRANPIVKLASGEYWHLSHFWQNFPAKLTLSPTCITYSVLSQATELQPGEGKTWRMNGCSNASPPTVQLSPEYINQCQVLIGTHLVQENALTALVHGGIEGDNDFFAKRERCDEYGWRHFGELYADHEALYVDQSQGIFVSHYNNQYDPIWGFGLRYLSTGERRWQTLQQDLKQHVIDIDIYKTDQDKAEYNFGLFWHTDHYLPALTATHRTYSKHHTSTYDGHQGGGGPGGQHCYTSGLTLHYFLTGDEDAKRTVDGLQQWIGHFYNGPNSLLSRLFRFITIDRKANQLTNIGIVAPGYKYPLDRGTGNYLNALIDQYQLTPTPELLDVMFHVVRLTLSPFDDLAQRNLLDIENNWFYVVFLQVLAKYLLLKEQLDQPDEHYHYARQAFNHYAAWLYLHEQPYLTEPEKLEFPNDTWAAQDIRKANVLYYAAYFAETESTDYADRADDFFFYVAKHLAGSAERHTTRVLAILMQNLGVKEWFAKHPRSPIALQPAATRLKPPVSAQKRLLKDLFAIAKQFSLNTELNWLKSRLPKR